MIVVVTKAGGAGVALEAFQIGVPLQFGELDLEPVGEFLRCFE